MGIARVVTACYGGFDQVRPQAEQDIDTEWVCFTDDLELEAPAPWRLVVDATGRALGYTDPRMVAKVPKMTVPFPEMVWIDANTEVTSPSFVREALECAGDGVALHHHPRRDCIYEEAKASLGAESQGGKYAGEPIHEQMAHYRVNGYPAHAGLFACGAMAWGGDVARNRRLGWHWLAECERWSIQDQLSFPVVCRKLGIEPTAFAHPQIESKGPDYLENRWLRIHPHRTLQSA